MQELTYGASGIALHRCAEYSLGPVLVRAVFCVLGVTRTFRFRQESVRTMGTGLM